MAKNQNIYRGIAVVNTNDTGEILFNFIKEQQYRFCMYDNGGDGTGCDPDSPLVEKFYLSKAFIPEEFFPPEYLKDYHRCNKRYKLFHPSFFSPPSLKLAQCNEEFYSFLKLCLGMSMYVTAFFNTFIPYPVMYRHISKNSERGLIPSCELFIEPQGHDSWCLSIFSNNDATIAALSEKYTAENFQVCRCMADDSWAEPEYEFSIFYEKISKESPSVLNKKFNWDLYKAKDT